MQHHSPTRTKQPRGEALSERLRAANSDRLQKMAWQRTIEALYPGAFAHGDKIRMPWLFQERIADQQEQ